MGSHSRSFRIVSTTVAAVVLASSTGPAKVAAAGTGPPAAEVNLTQFVNPIIGTDTGGTNPGAALPFGMVQMSPDSLDHRYFYPDPTISDFSVTHMSGAGCNNKGDVQFMPIVGAVGASPGTSWGNYQAPMAHDTETAAPGFYQVTLPNNQVKVELTATTRTGLTRLTYPATNQATILLNASRNNSFTDRGGELGIVGNNEVDGRFNGGGTCSNPQVYNLFYVIRFDRPFAGFGTWSGGTVSNGSRSTSGSQTGGFVRFDTTSNRVVHMRVALSYVSLDGARAAMAAESPGFDFSGIRAAANAAWNTMLNSVVVSGGTAEDMMKFYTALYHTFFTPNVTSDVNGDYLGFDNAMHNAGSRVIYQNYSGWDVYRSWIQVVALLAPQAPDILQSMVLDGQQGKALPMWSDANKELNVMVGDPGTLIVANAYALGVRNFDAAAALHLMDQSATDPTRSVRNQHDEWKNLHYYVENAATTIEYAGADFAIAQMASAQGNQALFQKYSQNAQNWKNSFNPARGHLQGRHRDGTFMEPWTPTTGDGYVEGNGEIYTWAVPWNLKALFAMVGGEAAAIQRLDAYVSRIEGGQDHPNLDMGNEPSFSEPWIFNSVHQPWKTQDLVNRLVTQRFHATQQGYPGDDDLASMSSWLVWAYLGMYPMIPGTDVVVLSTPRFPSATIRLANGNTVHVNAPGASPASHFTQSLSVNGSPTQRTWLRFGAIAGGATLDFQTGTTPNMSWGTHAGDEPPSFDVGTTTPPPTRFEAENATISPGSTVDTNHPGFSGTGFVNTPNVAGSFVEWTGITQAMAGTATVNIRYANGSTANRPANVTVNGGAPIALNFPPTGSWDTWGTATLTVALRAGTNTIRVTATTAGGTANLDVLELP